VGRCNAHQSARVKQIKLLSATKNGSSWAMLPERG
jgi:hypothetical protein